jgi:hypothetical protein
MKRIFLATYFIIGCSFFGLTQNWYLSLTGRVEQNGVDLEGASVTLMNGTRQVAQFITQDDGEFGFKVPPDGDFTVFVTKKGLCTKNFQLSTKFVPSQSKGVSQFDIPGIILFEQNPDVDYSILNQPIVKIKYDTEKNIFDYDEEYFTKSLAALDKLRQLEKEAIDRQKSINSSYQSFIKSGDKAFQKKDWAGAQQLYKQASDLKKTELYPKNQLVLIDNNIKVQNDLASKLAAEKLQADNALADKLAAEKALADKQAADKLASKLAAEKLQADRLSAKLASDKLQADKLLAEKKASEKALADKQAADRLAAKLASEKLQADKVLAEKLASEKALADKQAADKLASKLAAEKLQADKVLAEKLATEKALADKQAADRLAAKLASEKLQAEKALADKQAADRLAVKLASDKLQADKVLADKLAAEKALADKQAADRLAAKLASEKLQADKVLADKLASEKALADKQVAEKLAAEKNKSSNTIAPVLGFDPYKNAITNGDNYFKTKRYLDAKKAYQEALIIKANDTYAKNKLLELEKILNSDLANLTELDAKMKALMAKYPLGVTEETIEGPGVTVIQRVVVTKYSAYVYQKKMFSWGGITFLRDATQITEPIFEQETKP